MIWSWFNHWLSPSNVVQFFFLYYCSGDLIFSNHFWVNFYPIFWVSKLNWVYIYLSLCRLPRGWNQWLFNQSQWQVDFFCLQDVRDLSPVQDGSPKKNCHWNLSRYYLMITPVTRKTAVPCAEVLKWEMGEFWMAKKHLTTQAKFVGPRVLNV